MGQLLIHGAYDTIADPHPLNVWLRCHTSDVVSRSSTSSDNDAVKTTEPLEASIISNELWTGLDRSTSTGWTSTSGMPKEANRSWTYSAIWGKKKIINIVWTFKTLCA